MIHIDKEIKNRSKSQKQKQDQAIIFKTFQNPKQDEPNDFSKTLKMPLTSVK